MDLDKIMTEIYAPNTTQDRRLTTAVCSYTDIRNEYGNSSVEAEKMYVVMEGIFPEMKKYREVMDSLDAAFAKGEFQLQPGDLESVGLKNE